MQRSRHALTSVELAPYNNMGRPGEHNTPRDESGESAMTRDPQFDSSRMRISCVMESTRYDSDPTSAVVATTFAVCAPFFLPLF